MSPTERPLQPRVSIVMPVYNAAPTLGAALESISAQTFTSWECLIVDDGSTDGSAVEARRWAGRDGRFRLIEREHGGIVDALNAGLERARGLLVARQDADDRSRPDRLLRQVARLDADPAVGVVSCLVEEDPAGTAPEGFARYVRWTNTLRTAEEHRLNRFIESPVVHPTVLFRRDLVARWGGYRDRPLWPEDYELWLRWMEHGVVMAKVPHVLYHWRDSPGRLSRTHPRYSEEAFWETRIHYLVHGPLAGRPAIGVWGAGRVTRKRIERIRDYGVEIRFYVDIDPRKIGRTVQGRPVLGPEALGPAPDVTILACVGSRGAREEIRACLRGSRFVEGENFWCLA